MGGVRLDGANWPIHLKHHKRESHHEEASLGVRYFGRCNRLHRSRILDAKNKTECEKAGGVWVEKDKKCGAKKQ